MNKPIDTIEGQVRDMCERQMSSHSISIKSEIVAKVKWPVDNVAEDVVDFEIYGYVSDA